MWKKEPYWLLLAVSLPICGYCRTDTLEVTMVRGLSIICNAALVIRNDSWTRYTFDISNAKRDSVAEMEFRFTSHKGKESVFLLIDSIFLSNASAEKNIEDFELYITGTNVQDNFFADRFWYGLICFNGSIPKTMILQDNSKCLQYGGYNIFGEDFESTSNMFFGKKDTLTKKVDTIFQNWSEYQTVSLSIKRLDYSTGTACWNQMRTRHDSPLLISQNPVTRAISIHSSGRTVISSISFFSASGQRVFHGRDVPDNGLIARPGGFSKGVYAVKAVCGEKVYSGHFFVN